MQLGIIGLPAVGKTTIFQLMTNTQDNLNLNVQKTNSAMAKIPDERIDFLSGIFHPKKTTYAQIEVIDIPGLMPGADKSARLFLDAVRKADALLQVVRSFDNENAPLITGSIDPLKDIEAINYELLLADLDLVEKRIERIQSGKKRPELEKELSVLYKLKECLENETHISSIPLSEEEWALIDNYQLLTNKPMMICVNINEADLSTKDYRSKTEVLTYCRERSIPLVELSAAIEKELAELEEEDRATFMEDVGIDKSGIVVISKTMYARLGLISFFTVGEDEVKAWTIEEGLNARKAAGKIHSDIERGFIRAEVVDYYSFRESGSMAKVKEKGMFRLEGKDYIVKDGDIIHFRFNV